MSSGIAYGLGAFEKFAASSWGKKLAKQSAKAAQSDFDRFKTTLAKVGMGMGIIGGTVAILLNLYGHGLSLRISADGFVLLPPDLMLADVVSFQVKKARVVRKVVNQLKKAASKAAPKKK